MADLRVGRNGRGFARATMTDHNGETVVIQESSLADEPAIWLGVEGSAHVGPPWQRMTLPDGALIIDRAHLTVGMVRTLLPLLERFVATGQLQECRDAEVTT